MSKGTGTATLVNIDEELANNLVFFVSKSLPSEVSDEERTAFTDSCNTLIEAKKGLELASKVLEKGSVILGLEQTSVIEGCFQAIIAVILSFGEDGGAIKNTLDVLTAGKGENDKVTLRLKIMLGLFNFISGATNKHTTIMAIFNYALDTKQEESVASFHSRVGSWVSNWGDAINVEQQRALYLVVRKILQRRGGQAGETAADANQRFFISYLSTFPAAKLDSDAYDLAVDEVKNSINSPIASFEERAALLEALSQEQGNGTLKELLALLAVLCRGSLDEYVSFSKIDANVDMMKTNNIDGDAILRTMKLLSLCTLASGGKELLQYSEIAQALQEDEESVEMWVVDAIAEGILEANMDQFQRNVIVTRCSYRSFGKEQWKDVRAKLAALRGNVASVLDEMRKNNS